MQKWATIFITLWGLINFAHAQTYPLSPSDPWTTAECRQLSREYNTLIRALNNEHSAIGSGRGKQVHAGACCRASAVGNQSWCKTFISHAIAWEAIHCAENRKSDAVTECYRKVKRRNSKSFAKELTEKMATSRASSLRNPNLTDNHYLQTAGTYLYMTNLTRVVSAWLSVGNDPEKLRGQIIDTSKIAVSHSIKNPVISMITKDRISEIGITFDRVIDELEIIKKNFEEIGAEVVFPEKLQLQHRQTSTPYGTSKPKLDDVLQCKLKRSGGISCQKSRYTLEQLRSGGADCQKQGNTWQCF